MIPLKELSLAKRRRWRSSSESGVSQRTTRSMPGKVRPGRSSSPQMMTRGATPWSPRGASVTSSTVPSTLFLRDFSTAAARAREAVRTRTRGRGGGGGGGGAAGGPWRSAMR